MGGVSLETYRQAVKDGELTYVCRPCLQTERNTDVVVEVTRDEGTDEPPQLQMSLPVTDESTIMYDEPPQLELSTGIPGDDTDMQDWAPIADSTAINDEGAMDLSFDLTDRDFDPVTLIEERSGFEAMTETIIEDRGVTFTIIEGGSQKQKPVLVSSVGYAYGIKRQNKSSTVWRCNSRSKNVKCPVMVTQQGEHFVQKHEHLHPAVPDRELKIQIYQKRFQVLQKKADNLSKRSTEKRIKHLQKTIIEKVQDSLCTDEERDILREHDVKFGPSLKQKNTRNPNTDEDTCNSEQISGKCEWRDVQKYLGVNDHLTSGATSNQRHMSGLEKQIDAAIQDGHVHVAEELSDQLASRNFAVKINEAFTAKKFLKRKKEEEEQERSKQKKKLNWGFEHKQRWETKSNM